MIHESKPRQLSLELAHDVGRSRDHLVVSEANAPAVRLIDCWPDWPSPVVVLAGPPGSGKSHLASIWCEVARAQALSGGRIGQTLDHAAAFLVEDADQGGLDEEGLFHALNAIRASGGYMLLTARRFPSTWGVRLPDLKSRLRAAPTVEIGEPDDLLLSGVIAKLFSDRQLEVEPHVILYIVRRIERSLATAMSVVDKLDAAALEQNCRVTRALAASVIGVLDEGQAELPF